ncbi:MAG: hypothetical protein ACD_46C00219G0008 [uncultured bacterium]|nr:MAG: hypothetical protein ACD_46C00219G0008 [uncultured bacterium]
MQFFSVKNKISFIICLATLPITSFAVNIQNNYTLTLINHYSSPLTFSGRQNATDVLPELPAIIEEKNQITTKVVDIGKHAYVRVDGEDKKHSAFFGVEVANNEVKVHGYLSKGIAYSWKKSVVTFCSPDDYQKKGFCE